MGLVWQEVGKDAQARPPDWLTAGYALLLGLGVLVAAASHSWLYTLLQARLARKLPPDVMDLIQPSLLYTGVLLGALGFLGRRLAGHARGRAAAIATLALAALVTPAIALRWYAPIELLANADSSRLLAAAIRTSADADAPIFGYYYYRTSLPFYLRRPVGLLSVEWGEMTSNYQVAHQAEARRAGGGQPGGGVLLTVPEFRALAKSNTQPILVITPNRLVENAWQNAGRLEPLWNESDFSVWEIPPATAARTESAPAKVVPPFQP